MSDNAFKHFHRIITFVYTNVVVYLHTGIDMSADIKYRYPGRVHTITWGCGGYTVVRIRFYIRNAPHNLGVTKSRMVFSSVKSWHWNKC